MSNYREAVGQATARLFVSSEWNPKYLVDSDPETSDTDSTSSSCNDMQVASGENDEHLCSRCSQMFTTLDSLRRLTSEEGYEHYTKAELRKSAKKGCSFCKEVLWKRGNRTLCFDKDEPHESLKFFARREGTKEENFMHIPVMEESFPEIEGYDESVDYPFDQWKIAGLGCGNSSLGYNLIVRCVFTESDNLAARYVQRRSLAENFASEKKMSQARKWLEECRLGHPKCPQRLVPRLPTRVLDVGALGDSASTRLYVSKSDEAAEYVALSYCWGGPQLFTTTIATIEDRICSIPGNDLPKTIRDAIFVTRSLGIRYLWVDALCIIQDSYADKNSEIASMGSIYKSATVTISAACARAVDQGFLWTRNSSLMKAYKFPFLLPDGKMGAVSVASFDVRTQRETVEATDERAWCFQESLLAPRKLVFGSRELLWSCQTLENEPIAKSNTTYFYDVERLPRSVFDSQYQDKSTCSEKAQIWNTIVEGYTERSITNLDDRLPAISGVAEELARIWNDTHIHGMMRGTLIRNLPWHLRKSLYDSGANEKTKSEPLLLTPAISTSPSWSWTSVTSEVTILELDVVDATLVSVKDEYEPQYLGCRSSLILMAKLLPMQEFPVDFFVKNKKTFLPDCGDATVIDNTSVLLLLGSSDVIGTIGLILRRIEDGIFERIGLFQDPTGKSQYGKPSGVALRLHAASPILTKII
ncbi:hypothetical protein BP6252_13862 [Coleophoma cylindrospora]|uniref:Heterokaryon incompatibility domain-containing protein n=1 Tax=Coleophoma cylindrospora TaxID=1849047 RepID=A0A3D8Q5L9_9HELO|nr:hypothetical protein BP6252_13862 [Coleophoma cylindrospora]